MDITLKDTGPQDPDSDLPAYREQQAWLALLGMIVPYGLFFAAVAVTAGSDSHRVPVVLGLLAAASLLRVAMLGAGTWILRRRRPDAASLRLDERDQGIAQRSTTLGYGTMMAGFILVGMVMPFSHGGLDLLLASLLAILLAEITRDGAIIVGYRRG